MIASFVLAAFVLGLIYWFIKTRNLTKKSDAARINAVKKIKKKLQDAK